MPEVFGKATITVYPSLKEGTPISVLEAMASGVPMIGSDIPGIDDIVFDLQNGLLVPPRDPYAMANAILRLLNDEHLRRGLGRNVRESVVEKHKWNTVLKEIGTIYYESIRQHD